MTEKSLILDHNKVHGKSFIHITLSIDLNPHYQELVSMTSVMENCNKNKKIACFIFYLKEILMNQTCISLNQ